MALSEAQRDLIIALVKKGGMSNRAIALEVGCGNKVVGQIIKKYGIEKATIATLAKQEIENIIIQDEIKATKATYNATEMTHYNEVFVDMKQSLGMFNTAAIQNQSLINLANVQIAETIKLEPDAVLDLMPQIIMASKGTEQNRKQMFGNTETYKEVKEDKDLIEIEID